MIRRRNLISSGLLWAAVDGIFDSYCHRDELSLDSLVPSPPPSPFLAALVAAAHRQPLPVTDRREKARDRAPPSPCDAERRQAPRAAPHHQVPGGQSSSSRPPVPAPTGPVCVAPPSLAPPRRHQRQPSATFITILSSSCYSPSFIIIGEPPLRRRPAPLPSPRILPAAAPSLPFADSEENIANMLKLNSSKHAVPSSEKEFSPTVVSSCHNDYGQINLVEQMSAITFESFFNEMADKSGDVENPLTFNPLTFVEEENVETIMEDHVYGDVGHLLVVRRACLTPAVSNIGNIYDGPPIFDDASGLIDFVLPGYDTESEENACNIFESDGEDYEPQFSGFDLTYDVPCFDGDVDFVSQTNFNYFIANDSFFVSGSLKPPSYRLRILSHIRTADIFEAHIHAMLINFAFPGDEPVVASLILLEIILLQIRGRIFSKRERMVEIILHILVFIFI